VRRLKDTRPRDSLQVDGDDSDSEFGDTVGPTSGEVGRVDH